MVTAGGRSSKKGPTSKGVTWLLIDEVAASAVTFSRIKDVYSAEFVMRGMIGARCTMNVTVWAVDPDVDCAYTVTVNVPSFTLCPESVVPFHDIPGGSVEPRKYAGDCVAENTIGVMGTYW